MRLAPFRKVKDWLNWSRYVEAGIRRVATMEVLGVSYVEPEVLVSSSGNLQMGHLGGTPHQGAALVRLRGCPLVAPHVRHMSGLLAERSDRSSREKNPCGYPSDHILIGFRQE